MKADRLLGILFTLRTDRRVSARRLAEMFDCSERTILRDMDSLITVGVPVYADRGYNGGWYLSEAAQTDLARLSLDEVEALFLALCGTQLSHLGLRSASSSAIAKLRACMMAAQNSAIESYSERIYFDPVDWPTSPQTPRILPLLHQAVMEEVELNVTFEERLGDVNRYTVRPLGLVSKSGSWYLVGLASERVKVFKVDRIEELEKTQTRFSRPNGFRLMEWWKPAVERCLRTLPRFHTVVKATPALMPRLQKGGHYSKIERVEADGLVEISFEVESDAMEYLLACGPQLTVISPEPFRQKIADAVCKMCASYR